jgi:hypothetical protein
MLKSLAVGRPILPEIPLLSWLNRKNLARQWKRSVVQLYNTGMKKQAGIDPNFICSKNLTPI